MSICNLKHAAALQYTGHTMGRILHQDQHFHPYKMVIVQELYEHDWQNRLRACENMMEMLANDAIVLFSDEAHFHLYENK